MLTPTVEEIEIAFSKAKNVNSALKGFLKREVGGNEAVARFVKDFKAVATSARPAVLKAFIEANFPKHIEAFSALARYAHPELFSSTVEKIITTYADRFNETYKKEGESVELVDAPKFSSIVKEVSAVVDQALTDAGMAGSNFMKLMIFSSVFEEAVLKEVLLLS